MSPIILKDGDRPWLAAGASGGRRILAAVSQLMSFIADFGMTLEQAAHQPRIDVSDPDSVSADPRLPPEVHRRAGRGRSDRGRGARRRCRSTYACPNVILRGAGRRTSPGSATRRRPGRRRSRKPEECMRAVKRFRPFEG